MEKFRPEITFIADNKERSENDNFEQRIEKEAGATLNRAIDTVAAVFNDVRTISTDNETKQQAEKLKKETSSALATLYKKVKQIGVKAVKTFYPALIVGSLIQGEERIMDTLSQKDLPPVQHLDRDKLPLTLSFVDHYISSDLVDTHNKCVEFLAKRKNGKMSKEEIAYKEKIVNNIDPFGYGKTFFSDLERIKQINSSETERTPQKIQSKHELANLGFISRQDLFRTYLGLPQQNHTLSYSRYSPSQAKEIKKRYYQFSTQELLKAIFDWKKAGNDTSPTLEYAASLESNLPTPFQGKNFDDLVNFVETSKQLPFNHLTQNLGRYKAYVGNDKKTGERYISYYDKWDLDPPRLKVILGIDIDQFNFPFEIYGRIYERDFNLFLTLNDL